MSGMKNAKKDSMNVKVAYIGGGSREWAHNLYRELMLEPRLGGEIRLYDIDKKAAKENEMLGNMLDEVSVYEVDGIKYPDSDKIKNNWTFKAVDDIDTALNGVDFVFISILPGTFDEMESDVHTPEKYGIYQPVGDTVGPGGIIRALRTIPMYEGFAKAIKKNCPDAWVINYTNPMTMCVKTLYKVFPEIKAFGCCHEIFSVQKMLCNALKDVMGIDGVTREELSTNVVGVNHFTWITKAKYGDIDLFDVYRKYIEKHPEGVLKTWGISSMELVKFDLFKRFGVIAAAGDRHLSEFNPGYHYLHNPQQVTDDWKFNLTTVAWRKEKMANQLEQRAKVLNKEVEFDVKDTGEESTRQMLALLGVDDLITNVNIPNYGQIPNLPIGAVVETNAAFRYGDITPLFAGEVPIGVRSMVLRIIDEQEMVVEGAIERNLEKVFQGFVSDPLVTIPLDKARELFEEMLYNTREYLTMYDLSDIIKKYEQ